MSIHPLARLRLIGSVLSTALVKHIWAWVFTTISVGFAFLQAAISYFRPLESVSYDPTLAVLTLTLISVIWYTEFHFDELRHATTRDAKERLRATTTLATGVLEELRWLDGMLRQIHEQGPNMFYDLLEHPMVDSAIRQSTLFRPLTVGQLAAFYSTLRDTRSATNEFRRRHGQLDEESERSVDRYSRGKAALTVVAMRPLVVALVDEGGVLPATAFADGLGDGTMPPSPFS